MFELIFPKHIDVLRITPFLSGCEPIKIELGRIHVTRLPKPWQAELIREFIANNSELEEEEGNKFSWLVYFWITAILGAIGAVLFFTLKGV